MRAASTSSALALMFCAACGDSTDISGTYLGNAVYAASITAPAGSGLAGAEPWTVVVTDGNTDRVAFDIQGCMLIGTQRQQEEVDDKSGEDRFVFTSDDVGAGQQCALPITGGSLTLTVSQGDSVVDHGGTMTLELGGDISGSSGVGATGGYGAFTFQGATQ